MAKLIKNRHIYNNEWLCLFNENDFEKHDNQKLIVNLGLWQQKIPVLEQKKQNHQLGLFLDSHQSCDELPDDFALASVIAVHFPIFSDGRGYSIAKDLRTLKNYQGELRAVGEVLIDQLNAMERCGFDAFELCDDLLKEDYEIKIAQAFASFSQKYQADFMENNPVYRRAITNN